MNIEPSELKNKSLDELEKVSLEEQKNHFNLKNACLERAKEIINLRRKNIKKFYAKFKNN